MIILRVLSSPILACSLEEFFHISCHLLLNRSPVILSSPCGRWRSGRSCGVGVATRSWNTMLAITLARQVDGSPSSARVAEQPK